MIVERKKKIINDSTDVTRNRVIKSRPVSNITHKEAKSVYDLPSHLMVISKDRYNELINGFKIDRDAKIKEYRDKIMELKPIMEELKNAFELNDRLAKHVDINMAKISATNNIYDKLIKERQTDIATLKERESKLQEVILNDKGLLNEIDKVKKDKHKIEDEIESLKINEILLHNSITDKVDEYDRLRKDLKETQIKKGDIEEIYNTLELKEKELLNKEYQLEEGFKFVEKKKSIMKKLVRELEMRYQKNFSQYERFQLD